MGHHGSRDLKVTNKQPSLIDIYLYDHEVVRLMLVVKIKFSIELGAKHWKH
jgi:hypothetical protein